MEDLQLKQIQQCAIHDVINSAFGGLFYIGHDCLYKGEKYHIQDVNRLDKTVRIGIPDQYGLIWDTFWVDSCELQHCLY